MSEAKVFWAVRRLGGTPSPWWWSEKRPRYSEGWIEKKHRTTWDTAHLAHAAFSHVVRLWDDAKLVRVTRKPRAKAKAKVGLRESYGGRVELTTLRQPVIRTGQTTTANLDFILRDRFVGKWVYVTIEERE